MKMDRKSAALAYDDMNSPQTLYVRTTSGDYEVATDTQILAAARVAAESLIATGVEMNRPERVKNFFQAKLAGLGHECVGFVFLDTQFKVIQYLEPAQGTLAQASVYPREIVKTALRLNAAAIIMAHNHPSGKAEPSQADLRLTQHLKKALELIDVRLLDHIITTGQETISLAEWGKI
ncbi:TPA: JAB domain-containing protein [Klebsiella pneumoniae]